MITTLPLFSLCLSNLNVRRTERGADIESLAEDIAANGLKQNLVVIPAHYSTAETTENFGDKFEVVAGGRRYQALRLLAEAGRLDHDFAIPVLVEKRDQASETSLSENLHKVSINPADEFAAFSTIVIAREHAGDTRDAAIAACAKRFGKTVRHIEGRLRLASLCPEVLDALRGDRITLDAAKAYALTTDHDLQRKVFAGREKDKYSGHNANTIRYDIRGKTLPLDAPLVNFVGLVTYQAEGGRIEGEMFMGSEGQQRVVDVPLLEKLAKQIADAAIPVLVKTDGFKSGLFAKGIAHRAQMPKAPEGYEKAWDYGETPSKAKLKKSIAVYAVNEEGTGLERVGRFKPADETKKADAPRDWEAERAANARQRAIDRKAAQMALPSVKGTPLESVTFLPSWNTTERCDDEHTYVVLWIKVPIADIEAKRAEAERLVDEEAEAKAEAAKAEAEPDTETAEA